MGITWLKSTNTIEIIFKDLLFILFLRLSFPFLSSNLLLDPYPSPPNSWQLFLLIVIIYIMCMYIHILLCLTYHWWPFVSGQIIDMLFPGRPGFFPSSSLHLPVFLWIALHCIIMFLFWCFQWYSTCSAHSWSVMLVRLYVYGCFTWSYACLCTMNMPSTLRGQRKTWDSLEQDLQTFEINHVGIGIQSHSFWKSGKCF